MNETRKIGILGFGTVDKELGSIWKKMIFGKILGVSLVPSRASVRTLDKERKVKIPTDACWFSIHR